VGEEARNEEEDEEREGELGRLEEEPEWCWEADLTLRSRWMRGGDKECILATP